MWSLTARTPEATLSMSEDATAIRGRTTRLDPAQLRRFAERHGLILLVVAAFVGLGLLYSVRTPLFEAPDEPFHYGYVRWILDEGCLPPLVVSNEEWEQGEFHQPPLYYLLGAALTAHVQVPSDQPLYVLNPYANLGLPDAVGNKNAVIHTPAEEMPYRGVSRAVHTLRWFGVLLSAGTVWLAFRIASSVLPGRRGIAIGAAVLTAFNPQFLFASASANNDALVSLLCTMVLYSSVQVASGRGRTFASPIALGIAVGLAGLTKLSGLASGVIVLCAYGYRFWRMGGRSLWRDLLRPLLLVGALALSICGWWYLRNALQYGDPFGMRSYGEIFGVYDQSLPFAKAAAILYEALPSFWGVFGWMNVLADELFYFFFRVLLLLACVGLVLLGLRAVGEKSRIPFRRGVVLLLAVWILVVLGLLLQWTRTITGPQGRLMFPAIAAISLVLMLGLTEWVPRRLSAFATGLLAALLLAASLVAPFQYIAPAYALPRRLTLETVPPAIRGLDVAFGEELFLLGYDLPQESVRVGQHLPLRLYWLARKKMTTDYTFFVHLLGRDGVRIGGVDTYPGSGMYPTSQWIPGEVVVEEYSLLVSQEAGAPVAGVLRVGVYELPDIRHLPVRDAQGREIEITPQIARLRVAPRVISLYEPADRADANFGDNVVLMGHALAPETGASGPTWRVTLYWQALSQMSQDYTVFLHLLDDTGKLVAQVDEEPLEGQYPTSLWARGEQLKDVHLLPLPANVPSGSYQIAVGLYLWETGERLLVTSAGSSADAFSLGTVTVGGNVAEK